MKSSHLVDIPFPPLQSEPSVGIALLTKVSFRRGIAGLKFPWREGRGRLASFRTKILAYLQRLVNFRGGMILRFEELGTDGRFFLVERQLIDQFQAGFENAGLAISGDGKLSVLVNAEDHLSISAMERSGAREEVFFAASHLEELLGEKFNYAYTDEFGFLTASPLNSGCAMEVASTLHLPALRISGRLEGVFKSLYAMRFSVNGIYGEGSAAIGDIYRVSGRNSYGKRETDFLAFFGMAVENIIREEVRSRNDFFKRENVRAEDMIWRAYGVLKNARLLSYGELASHLSLVRLGFWKGLPGFGNFDIDGLLLAGQKNHLKLTCGKIKDEELEEKRADLARAAVGNSKA